MVHLNNKQKIYYDQRFEEFRCEYEHLKEPAMKIMLDQLIKLEIRINDINDTIFSEGDSMSLTKRHDALLRTYALMINRMGLTYLGRNTIKQKHTRKSPLELMSKKDDDKKPILDELEVDE